MEQTLTDYAALSASVFSDGTELFCRPPEPDAGEAVAIRLRIQKDADVTVTLLLGEANAHIPMIRTGSDDFFDWYEAGITCGDRPLFYYFVIEWEGGQMLYDRLGARQAKSIPPAAHEGAFSLVPGFHVPSWSKGALQYQIFPDRFRKHDLRSDVRDREYAYARGIIRHCNNWYALPEEDDYRCHYGGDLAGVLEKLDYLESLGVEAIYLNPVFVSPSSHRYDTQDYFHIDPHLTVIENDGGQVLAEGDHDNRHASMYIRRTTDPGNLQKSNEWFADFCREVHGRGMKIILDGVFNHCGSFNRWMDREGIYPGNDGAYGNPRSPYREYFSFSDDYEYECWWSVETLPKLRYEQSEELMETVLQAAVKWALPPYSIDGWRLDVAADLGQTRAFNHLFWREFRRRVRAVNPELLIIAEHYGDPSEWLGGDEWDSVMNYDAFMDPLSFFLTGMEKHSDYRRDDLYRDGEAFFSSIFRAMSHMPHGSVYCAMDELSNHDHSRFMTRTNGRPGRLNSAGSEAASEGIMPRVFREAAVIQMTWPGAPTIYYGDEAGLTGWTDPDNRRAYPWGIEDESLIDMHRELARIRRELTVLREGSVKALCAGYGYIAYARFDASSFAVTVCNSSDEAMDICLPMRSIGAADGTVIYERYLSDGRCPAAEGITAGSVRGGVLDYHIEAHTAAILIAADRA